jgi:predicted nucleic acid-binding protein
VSLYLDASVIVPSLVEEEATATVDRYLSSPREPLMVSALAAVEVASALSRLVRMNFIPADVATMRLSEFDAWRPSVEADAGIPPIDFQLAGIFIRRSDLGLRAPDALHAAACRRADHVLVTLDRRLATAAEALGVRVEWLGEG